MQIKDIHLTNSTFYLVLFEKKNFFALGETFMFQKFTFFQNLFCPRCKKKMSVNSPFADKAGSFLGNFMIPAAAVLGSLVAFGVFSNKQKNHIHSHVQIKSVQTKSPLAASVQITSEPAKPSLLITKVNSALLPAELPQVETSEEVDAQTEEVDSSAQDEPVLQVKSLDSSEQPTEEVQDDQLPVLAEVQVPAPSVESKETELTAEQTFEQYRQAMLHTGPRDMEYQARAEMQSKGGMGNNAMWRTQTASLRKSLQKDAASLLDEMNVSINDRVVSDFNNVRDL